MAGSQRMTHAVQSATLADVLERILDKGLVIAGDIKIKLVDIELLSIQIRLLVASVDKAREIGLDWWSNNPFFANGRLPQEAPATLPGPGPGLPEAPAPVPAGPSHPDPEPHLYVAGELAAGARSTLGLRMRVLDPRGFRNLAAVCLTCRFDPGAFELGPGARAALPGFEVRGANIDPATGLAQVLLGRAPGHPNVDLPYGADVGLLDLGVSVRAGVPVGETTMSVSAEYSADPPARPGGSRGIAGAVLATQPSGRA